MLTKKYESMIRLHTHTHTHTHNCYKQIAVDFYAIFVRNVNKKYIENLVKEGKFL